jgi:four helix bundle protein
MSTFKKFEDIEAWQKARTLCQMVYTLTKKSDFAKDFDLKNQIRRSSGSVMDNIAEGFERGGNREFIQFLSIAKASAGEVRSQLYRAIDNDYITKTEFDETYALTNEVGKMISGLMNYLNQSGIKGIKYKSN